MLVKVIKHKLIVSFAQIVGGRSARYVWQHKDWCALQVSTDDLVPRLYQFVRGSQQFYLYVALNRIEGVVYNELVFFRPK